MPLASIPIDTLNIVLEALRKASEYDAPTEGWRGVYLDNARPTDISPVTFRGCLSILAKKGLYKRIDSFAWGEVKMTDHAPVMATEGPTDIEQSYLDQGYIIVPPLTWSAIHDMRAHYSLRDIDVPLVCTHGIVGWGVPMVNGKPLTHPKRYFVGPKSRISVDGLPCGTWDEFAQTHMGTEGLGMDEVRRVENQLVLTGKATVGGGAAAAFEIALIQ